MYKKIAVFAILSCVFVSLSSCGVSANYLTQNSNHVNTAKKERVYINKIKKTLEKPVINYDDKIKELASIDTEDVLESIDDNSFTSYFDLMINKVIHEAESYIGTPYRFGGTTRRGIDCSAFMQRIYEKEGIELPRVSQNQAKIGYPVDRDELQKGDLIFFSTTSRHRVTHVGMVYDVTPDGKVSFIHASSSRGVAISDLDNSYWQKRYRTARRIEAFASPQLVKNSKPNKTDI